MPKVKYNSKTKWKCNSNGHYKIFNIYISPFCGLVCHLLVANMVHFTHSTWLASQAPSLVFKPHDFHICSILAKARTALHCTAHNNFKIVQWKSRFQKIISRLWEQHHQLFLFLHMLFPNNYFNLSQVGF
jgi:hypothetical protein